jgi:hypothetical protein
MRMLLVYWLTALTVFAELPAEWKQVQQLTVTQPGLIKLRLPAETLNGSRPALEDLRIFDPDGREVPYLIERPVARPAILRAPKRFQVKIDGSTTLIDIETGVAQPIDGFTLDTPAASFIKAVSVEGSRDGQDWQALTNSQPIFRQPNGVSQLRVSIPEGVWPWLRVTVDDRRSESIPFTGVTIHAIAGEPVPTEALRVAISDRTENDGQTRLTLDLGANHLTIASLRIETSEPLFTRPVTVAVREVSENSVTERALAHDTIYRVNVEGLKPAERVEVPLDLAIQGRELLVLIDNGNNQPLRINAVEAARRPVFAVFLAQQAGTFHVLTGNPRCAAPRYDVAAFASRLKGLAASSLALSSLEANPSYQPGEALPEIHDLGTALDVSEWQYRKRVELARASVQQLDLDLEVLSHAQPSLRDLRLVDDGKQRPYILERTSITRKLTPQMSVADDPKRPTVSRWSIKLPHAHLPISRVTCTTSTGLFRRNVVLYEEPIDERGEKYSRQLAQSTWVRTPPATTAPLELHLNASPQTDTLILETDNGDNAPITLDDVQAFYPVTRVLFKAPTEAEMFLYYGNSKAGYPQYDLDLIAPRLLAEEKSTATLAAEEALKKSSVGELFQLSNTKSIVFWGALGAVVVVLLFVIARLLPKSPPPQG